MPELPEEAISEFIKLCQKKRHVTLSVAQARDAAEKLIELYTLAFEQTTVRTKDS